MGLGLLRRGADRAGRRPRRRRDRPRSNASEQRDAVIERTLTGCAPASISSASPRRCRSSATCWSCRDPPCRRATSTTLPRKRSTGGAFARSASCTRRLAAERPCIIAVDDLHWANPTILDFMARASELTGRGAAAAGPQLPRGRRRAVVGRCASTPAARPATASSSCALGPLGARREPRAGPGAARRGDAGRPGRELLLSRIDGNPLYAYELIQTLVDRGALVIKAGRAQLDDEAAAPRPRDAPGDDPGPDRPAAGGGSAGGPDRRRARTDVLAPALTRVFGDGPALERGAPRGGPSRRPVRAADSGPARLQLRPGAGPGGRRADAAAPPAPRDPPPGRRGDRGDLPGRAQRARPGAGSPRPRRRGRGTAAARYALLAAERAAADYATRQALRFYELGLEATEHLGERRAAGGALRAARRQGRGCWRTSGRMDECVVALRAALDVARTPALRGGGDAPAAPSIRRGCRARLALMLATMSMHRLETDAAEAAVSEAFEVLDERHSELASAWALRSWILMHRNQIARGRRRCP